MQKFERADFEVAEYVDSENYGKFVLSPLERGFGTTIGNALRRVLLSSLPGAAVFSIKVDGVYHEFTTISGVREDVSIPEIDFHNSPNWLAIKTFFPSPNIKRRNPSAKSFVFSFRSFNSSLTVLYLTIGPAIN